MQLKHQPTEQLKQTPHIVAFLDFLGASEKMRDPAKNDKFLQEINAVYKFAQDMHEQNDGKLSDRFKIKIFSDNIVVAEEIENIENPQSVLQAYTDVEQFSLIMYIDALLNKNVIRGAIAIGELYMDDVFVFGNGLLDAYEGESKKANYPRIIVDNKVRTILPLPDKENIIQCDVDDKLYLSPFWGIQKITNGDILKANLKLWSIHDFIINEYKYLLAENKESVLSKYHWLADQFNQYCQNNNFNFQIDLDKLTLEGKNE